MAPEEFTPRSWHVMADPGITQALLPCHVQFLDWRTALHKSWLFLTDAQWITWEQCATSDSPNLCLCMCGPQVRSTIPKKNLLNWGRTKGAEKVSCGETVVQKGVESLFLLCPLKVLGVRRANLKGAEKKETLQKHPLDNCFSARRLFRSFGAFWQIDFCARN